MGSIIEDEKENNKKIKVSKPDKISFDKKIFKTSGKLNYPIRKTGLFGVGKLWNAALNMVLCTQD